MPAFRYWEEGPVYRTPVNGEKAATGQRVQAEPLVTPHGARAAYALVQARVLGSLGGAAWGRAPSVRLWDVKREQFTSLFLGTTFKVLAASFLKLVTFGVKCI